MNLSKLKQNIDELIKICFNNNIDLKNVNIEFTSGVMNIEIVKPNIAFTFHNINVECKISNSSDRQKNTKISDMEILKQYGFE